MLYFFESINNKMNQKTKKFTPVKLFVIITFSIIAAVIIWFIILPLVLNVSTSVFSTKQEMKLTAFSPEAFAYELDKGWEVDATTRIKGFTQIESDNKYKAKISFTVDLITPAGKTIKDVDKKIADKIGGEKMMDTGLETQFDLDTTYVSGKYKVVFNIKDMNSGKTTTSSAEFQLGN